MEERKLTVCVIGAGLSGLTSLKCMLDAGFQVTCIEKENRVAGRWNPDCEYPIPSSTITNLPHFLSGYSDFPVPDDFPLYLPADLYLKYFELFVEEFNLLPHIKLGCRVISATPHTRFDKKKSSGSCGENYWRITYETKDGSHVEMEFDYLVVCSGFYRKAYVPDHITKALSNFKGKVIHCMEYKSFHEFENKKVIVCGLGNSGGDIVTEISRHTDKTFLSTSRGSYVVGRIVKSGQIPVELAANRILQYLPDFVKGYLGLLNLKKMANFVFNLDELRLTPKSSTSVIVNDEMCSRIVAGKVVVKPGLERTSDHTVYFTDDSSIDDVDAIILCTGYKRSYPFFSEDLFQMESSQGKYIPLYKGIFSPNFPTNTAFVGMFSVLGSVAMTAEMQARYAAEVFRGKIVLPKTKVMEDKIKATEDLLKMKYGDELKEFNVIMNPWGYYDELASEIGCRPSLIYLWFTDPLLAWNLCTTYTSMEYRLIGPNKWTGARDAILSMNRRRYNFMQGSRKIL